jgi:rubrerythrin
MAKDKKAGARKAVKAGKKYTCAMKCVEADKPGKCPKCGMPMKETK